MPPASKFVSGHLDNVKAHVEQARDCVQAEGDALPPMGAALLENLAAAAARMSGDFRVVATSTAALAHIADAPTAPASAGRTASLSPQRAVGLLWSGIPAARQLAGNGRRRARPSVALTVISARANFAWCSLLGKDFDPAEATAREVISDCARMGIAAAVAPGVHRPRRRSLLRGDAEVADRLSGLAAVVGGVEWWPTPGLSRRRR